MKTLFILLLCLVLSSSHAQQSMTLTEMIAFALRENENIRASALDIELQKQRRRYAVDIGKTQVMYVRGQINTYIPYDYNLNVSQNIPFPVTIVAQQKLGGELVKASEIQKTMAENDLVFEVKKSFYTLTYLKALEAQLFREDSIYTDLIAEAGQRHKAGQSHLLEVATAESQLNEVKNQRGRTQGQIIVTLRMLQNLLHASYEVRALEETFSERPLNLLSNQPFITNNPTLTYLKQRTAIVDAERKVAVANLWPGLNIGFFTQTLVGSPTSEAGGFANKSDPFLGFQVGLNIPLWIGPQLAKVKAADISRKYQQSRMDYREHLLEGEWEQAVQTYLLNKNSLLYYETEALTTAEKVLKESQAAYKNHSVDYPEYWLAIEHVIQIQKGYLNSLNEVNLAVIYLEYLSGAAD